MASKRDEKEHARRREAEEALSRVANDSETIGSSSLARVAERARAHMAAEDAADEDAIEIWGRRIGRALSVAGVISLTMYLVLTYVVPKF